MDRREPWTVVALVLGLLVASVPGIAQELPLPEPTVVVPVQEAALQPDDPVVGGRIGHSVGVSGSTAIVGGFFAGQAYLFEGTPVAGADVPVREWTVDVRLEGSAGERFGTAADVDGDRAVVTAPRTGGSSGPDRFNGHAFLYRRGPPDFEWRLEDAVSGDQGCCEGFGSWEADLDGDRVAVGSVSRDVGTGAEGMVYVFERLDGGEWVRRAGLLAPDREEQAQLGSAVALDGDTVVGGAPLHDHGAVDTGGAYVWVRQGPGDWGGVVELLPDVPQAGAWFGWSAAISGDTVAVGAPLEDTGAGADAGAVHLFERVGPFWQRTERLVADDGSAGDQFGFDVALDGDALLVGAPGADADAGEDQGATYLFDRLSTPQGPVWVEAARLVPDEPEAGAAFGYSVDLDQGTAVVGAVRADWMGGVEDVGAAYVFPGVRVSAEEPPA